jgi:Ca2+-binding RTX toxin-like protein
LALACTSPAAAAPRCLGERATIVGTAKSDRIRGTQRADVIVADGDEDLIRARAGHDRVCAGSGFDVIFDGAGNDRVRGGRQDDTVYAGPGNDRIKGGRGSLDGISFERAPRRIMVDLGEGTAFGFGTDLLGSVEVAGGSRYGDSLRGDNHQNFLNGGRGADDIFGFGGLDVLIGERGPDRLRAGREADFLNGDQGDDFLDGGEGHEIGIGDDGDGGPHAMGDRCINLEQQQGCEL